MIPDFQTVMLPMLEILSDGKEYSSKEMTKAISDRFNLSEAERNELLPSENQLIIDNRVAWAKTYLNKAKLLTPTKRSHFVISESGIKLLKSKPSRVDIKYLKTLPEFKEWQKTYNNSKKIGSSTEIEEEIETEKTPEELLDYSVQKIRNELSEELLDKIKTCSPRFFEQLVVDLLIKIGYGGSRKEAGSIVGKSGDGGIDGIIKEDKLGLDTIYIQAKRWENTVPIGQIRDFAGSLLQQKAKKGIFLTTSDFPNTAYEFVKSIEHKIVLINGKELANYLIEYNVGIQPKKFYEIKKLDLDYFEE
jgi:restriction system protein